MSKGYISVRALLTWASYLNKVQIKGTQFSPSWTALSSLEIPFCPKVSAVFLPLFCSPCFLFFSLLRSSVQLLFRATGCSSNTKKYFPRICCDFSHPSFKCGKGLQKALLSSIDCASEQCSSRLSAAGVYLFVFYLVSQASSVVI